MAIDPVNLPQPLGRIPGLAEGPSAVAAARQAPAVPASEPSAPAIVGDSPVLLYQLGFAQVSPSAVRVLMEAQERESSRVLYTIPDGYRGSYDRYPPTSYLSA